MTPVVVVLVVVLALGALAGLTFLVVGRVVRFWSRTREQANVVFSVQMEVMALVHATLQRCDAADPQGERVGHPAANGQAHNDVQARTALRRSIVLLKDDRLRQITRDLVDCTGRLPARPQPGEAARVRAEVQSLQESFRLRSHEVVRDLRLGRR